MRVSKRWKEKAAIYRRFAEDWEECCDFSEEAAEAMYGWESVGQPRVVYSEKQENGLYNGYAVGKHWLDVTRAMWLEDLTTAYPPMLTKAELGLDRELL